MHLTYGPDDGTVGFGRMGYADISLAGIKVTHQQLGIINYTNIQGDGFTNGILGLAYSFGTHAFNGTNATADSGGNRVEYDALLPSIMNNNKQITSFSIAQPRGSPNAYLAFGGVPPVQFEDKFASTPIRTAEVLSPSLKGKYLYYIATIQGFVYDGAPANATASTELNALVDTGTSDVYVPTDVYKAVLKLFQPPAQQVEGHQAPFAPCNATPPAFGVTIGGQTFQMSKETMFSNDSHIDVNSTKYCSLSIRDGGTGGIGQPFVLGYAFLQNVVTVYDVGAAQLRFAALK